MDTDVILDLVLKREPFFVHAARLFQAGMAGRVRLLASAGALKDVLYFARKATVEEAKRGQAAGNEKRGREAIRLLLQVVEACPLDRAMWEEALASPLRDTEDALQVACAKRAQAEFLVTRNGRDFEGTQAPQVIRPELLVASLLA